MSIDSSAFIWFGVAFGVVALLFFRALFVLLYECVRPLRRLGSVPTEFTAEADPDTYLPGKRAIERRANSICRRLKAAESSPDGQIEYDLDRDLRALRGDVAMQLAVVRAAAGVLIIVGLLITLFNLRGAVGELERTFSTHIENAVQNGDATQSSGQPNKAIDTKTVREGMLGIAGAAKKAFLLSAIVICIAAALLVLAFIASQFAASRIRSFEWWAEDLHRRLLEKAASRRPEDVIHNLSSTVEHLANLTKTFETTNSALQELKSFGDKMDSAAQQITLAVANLPSNIGASMATISAEVAQGINQDLRHQGEYLKGILAIYSDQQNVLKKMVDFIESVSKSQKASSDALLGLQTLPQQVQAVAQNVKTAAETMALVHSTTKLLERKIEALPMDELNAASTELRASLANIGQIERTLTDFKEQLTSSMASSSTHVITKIKDAVDRAASEISAAKASITVASETTVSRLSTMAAQLKLDLDQVNKRSVTVSSEQLLHRLDDIVSEIRHISLNPFRGLFGRRDGSTNVGESVVRR